MRLNPDLKLRKIGSRYMIVDTFTGKIDLTNVFILNETAAYLWHRAEGLDFTVEKVVKWLCEEYDVEKNTAQADSEKLLAQWEDEGMVK